MEVYLSRLAEAKLLKLNQYLSEKWGEKVRDKFKNKLSERIEQISSHPESCPKSSTFQGLYKCVVTRQTTFFYRIHYRNQEIEIITVFDTRQDPNKLSREIY